MHVPHVLTHSSVDASIFYGWCCYEHKHANASECSHLSIFLCVCIKHMCVCIHVCACMHLFVCLHVCLYVCVRIMCACMSACVSIFLCVCIQGCMLACVYANMYICMHVYVCITCVYACIWLGGYAPMCM